MGQRIAVIGGDGIGPEVARVGCAILEKLNQRDRLGLELWELDLGAERYLRDGTTFPEAIRDELERTCQAVLLGALGDPRVPNLEHARDILFGIRFGFDLFANMRPVQCMHASLMPLKGVQPSDCDFVVFRENTEGLYAGIGGNFKKGTPDEIAVTESINTRRGVERIIRHAFEHAQKTGRSRVHMADKSNAMPAAHGLWRRCFAEVADEYAGIEARHMYVDALCYQLIRDPSQFEVIVTSNLLGDIVTDLAAALQGGLGMAASGNIHPGRLSMFEPVHGSAPDIAGQGKANPFAMIMSVAMMLAHLGFQNQEEELLKVVGKAVVEGVSTPDIGGTKKTDEVAAWVLGQL